MYFIPIYMYENWGCFDVRTNDYAARPLPKSFPEIILYGQRSYIYIYIRTLTHVCVVYSIRNRRRPNLINGRRRDCSRNEMRNRPVKEIACDIWNELGFYTINVAFYYMSAWPWAIVNSINTQYRITFINHAHSHIFLWW